MRVIIALAAATIVTATAACSADDEPPEDIKSLVPRVVDLPAPLGFHRVTAEAPGPCPEQQSEGVLTVEDRGSGGGPACLTLTAEPDLRVTQLAGLEKSEQQGQWALTLTLVSPDGKAFTTLTGELATEQPPANRLVVLRDGELLTAPAVQSVITGRKVQIAGNYTEFDIDSLAARIRGPR
jgi:preprotein translocase subunit SecD